MSHCPVRNIDWHTPSPLLLRRLVPHPNAADGGAVGHIEQER